MALMPKEIIQLLLHKNYLDRPSNIMANVNPKPWIETAASEIMTTYLFLIMPIFQFYKNGKLTAHCIPLNFWSEVDLQTI